MCVTYKGVLRDTSVVAAVSPSVFRPDSRPVRLLPVRKCVRQKRNFSFPFIFVDSSGSECPAYQWRGVEWIIYQKERQTVGEEVQEGEFPLLWNVCHVCARSCFLVAL